MKLYTIEQIQRGGGRAFVLRFHRDVVLSWDEQVRLFDAGAHALATGSTELMFAVRSGRLAAVLEVADALMAELMIDHLTRSS